MGELQGKYRSVRCWFVTWLRCIIERTEAADGSQPFFLVCTLVLYDGASVGAFNLGVVTASEMRSVPITARSANARKSVVHRTSLRLMLKKAFLPCLIDTYTSNRAASSGP